jgi:uncharacterized protein YcfJ
MISRLLIFVGSLLGAIAVASAQSNTLAATIGVHVFPADAQDAAEQSRDEANCFEWAVDSTGSDPFDLARQSASQEAAAERAAQQAQTAGQGNAARSAVRGAVAGAVVGNVFGSSSRSRKNIRQAGAVIGAGVGASNRQMEQAQAASAANRAAGRAAATEDQINSFRTAFSACMEANDYVARF